MQLQKISLKINNGDKSNSSERILTAGQGRRTPYKPKENDRWVRLLKQEPSITAYRKLMTFSLVLFYVYIHMLPFQYIYWYIRKTEAQAIFPSPFTVCSSNKRKFFRSVRFIRWFTKKTNGSYPLANGLNGFAVYDINNIRDVISGKQSKYRELQKGDYISFTEKKSERAHSEAIGQKESCWCPKSLPSKQFL